MAPDPAAADRAERGRAWRRRAAEALGPIGADRVATRASSVPWDDRLVVDAWAVRAAERCLA
ncbi:MAG TPA: hypothetical protein VK866_06085, partial [Acidimicrobiales bacterium]|nr:hypothetical protein [Acidimicrobiales bacterium]